MSKKCLIIALICICTMCVIAGCDFNDTNISSNNSETKKNFEIKDLNIEDFEWRIIEKIVDGQSEMFFVLDNNSQYDLLGTSLTYRVKRDLAEEQRNVFYDFYNRYFDNVREYAYHTSLPYSEKNTSSEKSREEIIKGVMNDSIIVAGEKDEYIPKGSTTRDFPLEYKIVQFYSLTYIVGTERMEKKLSIEEFELLEPNSLSLTIIGEDGKAYSVEYNYYLHLWSVNKDEIDDLNELPKIEFLKNLPEPTGHIYRTQAYRDDERYNGSRIYVYNISTKGCDEYINKMEKLDYRFEIIDQKNPNGSEYWEAYDNNRNKVTLLYEGEKKLLTIDVNF